MTDLSQADRLRLYSKMGMGLEMTPEAVAGFAELIDAAEDTERIARETAEYAERVHGLLVATIRATALLVYFGAFIALIVFA